MKIYSGKNKLKAKETTLKQLILENLDIDYATSLKVEHGVLSDNSASWIEIQKKTRDREKRFDINFCFDPENDNKIIGVELYVSKKLHGYDEENMKKL